MSLKLFNTLTRQKDEFKPIVAGKVGYYSCGLTVYNYAHIGNLRTYIFTDTLRRVLEYNGYEVNHIMNITDVGHLASDEDEGEDKIDMEAQKTKKTPYEIAEFYTQAFFKDMEELNIQKPTLMCKATEHISDMIALIEKLVNKGYAYVTKNAVYYDTSKFKDYGKLARLNLDGQNSGARVEVDSEKKNPFDFALWKINQPNHIMQWDSPWGRGFPGWHIECSAMSMKYLGETFDIHSGGIDHIPVHHTNEIAQSEGATGKKFVNYWVHANFLQIKDTKMSKSLANFYTLRDLKNMGFEPMVFKMFVLMAKYRAELSFTDEALTAAKTALEYVYNFVTQISEEYIKGKEDWIKVYEEKFLEAVNDDLNTPQAVAVVLEIIQEAYKRKQFRIYDTLLDFDKVLGIRIKEKRESLKEELPDEIKTLITERENARKSKDWAKSDALRKQIESSGYILEDTPEGMRCKKKE
ncbi:MAG: cysteine--tRNA ligase [bacterium]|nr:cysteine--tRNA ligase [bacterium]